jgi:hypothetical protein
MTEISIKVKRILNGYILTLESGNEQFFSNLESLLQRIKEDIGCMN